MRNIFAFNFFLLYDAEDWTILIPVIITGYFQQRLVNSQANYFQDTKLRRMTIAPFNFID